jgi:hypothetical protein
MAAAPYPETSSAMARKRRELAPGVQGACRRDLDHRRTRPCNCDLLLVARNHGRAGHGRCDVRR